MNSPRRLSAVHDRLQQLEGDWGEINGMPALLQTPCDLTIAKKLGIADLSGLARFGVKGAAAAAWLAEMGIAIDRPNSWISLPEGGLAARLGLSEYLIEDSLSSAIVSRLVAGGSFPDQVYPVLRQDLALALWGESIPELLLQTCNVNFHALTLSENPIVLTTMIGVAVTVLPSVRAKLPFYRIWCDGTFGSYFWCTLLEIIQELGGNAIGALSILTPNPFPHDTH